MRLLAELDPSDRLILGLGAVGALVAPFNLLIGVPLGGLVLRPLQIWCGGVLLVALALRPRMLLAGLSTPALAFLTLFAGFALSTALATPPEYRFRGYADAILLFLNIGAFVLPTMILRRVERSWVLLAGVGGLAAAAWSLLAVRSALSAHANFALTDSNALGLSTVVGTYATAYAAASAGSLIVARGRRAQLISLAAFAIFASAALLSLARGPWIGFAIALVATVSLAALGTSGGAQRVAFIGRAMLPLLVAAVLGSLVVTLSATVRGVLLARILSIANVATGTGLSRLQMWHEILLDALRSPVFGNGGSAYRRISETMGIQGTISENFGLEMFHAAGLLGLFAFAVGTLSSLYPAARALTQRADQPSAAVLAGAVTLVMGAMTNPAAWNGAFWFALALAASLPRRGTPAFEASGEPFLALASPPQAEPLT